MGKTNILTAYGTTAGNSHKKPHGPGAINNQDAVRPIIVDGDVVGGVVCDGCGSTPYSDIGAHFGAKAIADIIATEYKKPGPIKWEEVRKRTLAQIKRVAKVFQADTDELDEVIADYFQFTVVIAVVRDEKVTIMSVGDGTYVHDDDVYSIDTRFKNAPPYLAYALIPSKYGPHPEDLKFQEVDVIPISKVKKSVIIGSDGLCDLAVAKTKEIHHPIFMMNEMQLGMWLKARVFSPDSGVTMSDDVTLFIIRPEEVQRGLIKKAEEIGGIKNQVIDLQGQVGKEKEKVRSLEVTIKDLMTQLTFARAQIPKLPPIVTKNSSLMLGGEEVDSVIGASHPAGGRIRGFFRGRPRKEGGKR